MFDSDLVRSMMALAVMGAAVGAILGALRYIPKLIFQFIQRKWAVSITTRDQELIRWLGYWMAQSDYGQVCQWLDARTVYTDGGLRAVIMPGHGMHSFKQDGVRYWLDHQLEDQGVAGKQSLLTIKTMGKGREPLEKLIGHAVDLANEEHRNKNVTFVNDKRGYWMRVRLSPRRSKNSLFLRHGLFDEIVGDANGFLDNPEKYINRGLPYRRGYLLHGSPGNGKSTIIQVLATELNLPIYMLSLTEPEMTDNSLALALGRTPDRCLLVIEDFEKIDLDQTDVTVSGLLNAIDGPLASEGRLLVITANEPDAINKYFLRPGRVDRRWLIDSPEMDVIEECMERFGVNGVSGGKLLIAASTSPAPWSMARVQQELLGISETLIEPFDPSDAGPEPEPIAFSSSGGDGDGETNSEAAVPSSN